MTIATPTKSQNVPQIKRGELPLVTMYTDGSCPPDSKEGGWCVILVRNAIQKVFGGYEANSTNNRMELRAVLEGIARLRQPCQIQLVTDSQLVIGWIFGWDTVLHKPNRNMHFRAALPIREYVQQVNQALWDGGHVLLEPEWVRGHAGHPQNELADRIAKFCRENKQRDYAA